MTLHEAIRIVLVKYGNVSAREVAERINQLSLYQRRDQEPVTPSQITSRISKYPELFEVKEGIVHAKSQGLSRLKEIVDELSAVLSSEQDANAHEVLLPALAVLLKYGDPNVFIFSFKGIDSGITEEEEDFDVIMNKLNEKMPEISALNFERVTGEFKRLDQTSRFYGLLTEAISQFQRLNERVQHRVVAILQSSSNWAGVTFVEKQSITDLSANREEYSIQNINEDEFRTFFERLINEYSWKKGQHLRFGSTPPELTMFLSKLLPVKDGEVVFDPFIGKGSLLANFSTNVKITGGDKIENAITIGKLNFAVHGIKEVQVYQRDAFSDWGKDGGFANWFISNPPFFGSHYFPDAAFEGYGAIKKNNFDLLVKMGLFHTRQDGKVCVVLPAGFITSSARKHIETRKHLVDQNLLNAVIYLPSGLFSPFTEIKTALLILDKERSVQNRTKCLLYDLSKSSKKSLLQDAEPLLTIYTDESIESVPDVFVATESIKREGYSFDINRYKERRRTAFSAYYRPIIDLIATHVTEKNRRAFHFFPGNKVSADDLGDSGIPFIQSGDLKDDPSDFTIRKAQTKRYVADTTFILPAFVEGRKLLIATSGNKLKPTLYDSQDKALISSDIFCMAIDERIILMEYLILEMREESFIAQVESIRKGTFLKSFNWQNFLNLEVNVPPLDVQRRIVDDFRHKSIQERVGTEELSYVIGELKHKINGPLGSIRAAVSRLEKYLQRKEKSGDALSLQDLAYNLLPGENPNERQQYSVRQTLATVFSSVERIDRYLKRVSQFETISASQIALEETDLTDLLTTVVFPAFESRMKLRISTAKRFRAIGALADKDLLACVFENFIENAFVHGFGGVVKTDAELKIYWQKNRFAPKDAPEVIIYIENNGIANPALTKEKFIAPGVRDTASQESMGIGGALIHKALTAMQGSVVDVETISGGVGGFTMRFTIKLLAYEH